MQVFDGSDAQFEAGSEGLWLGNAVAIKLKQGYEPPFFGQENLKAKLGLMIFDEGFLPYERFVGLDIGRGEKLERTNQITVLIADQGEVSLVGQQPVFLEMMQAGDVLENQPFNFPENGLQVRGRFRALLEELHYCLGGDAVWVETAGQNAVILMAPAQAPDLVFGEEEGLLEEELPLRRRLEGEVQRL